MATKVIMPQLGESVVEGTIANWLKKEGDRVDLYEPILEIETDKVTTESTAEVAGTLLKILVPEGEVVEVGRVLALIGEPGEDVSSIGEDAHSAGKEMEPSSPLTEEAAIAESPVGTVQSAPQIAQPATNGPGQQSSRSYEGRVSPVVSRIAGEHGVDLNLVPGTGLEGRITKRDVLNFIESDKTAATKTQASRPPSTEPIPGELLTHTSMRRSIADHMVRSKKTSPHVTTVFDVDFTSVTLHRDIHKARFNQDGAKLTFTVYIVSAIAQALKAYPLVNSSWSDEGILVKKEINIGLATAIPNGLIVPVIKNADILNLLGLARAINDMADRARKSQLLPDEVQGGTFTLTNHGVSGSLFATPIINQPQCGILGIGKIEKRVKVIDDAIAIRPMAYASLTFDHRILDGASADMFMSTFKSALEEWR